MSFLNPTLVIVLVVDLLATSGDIASTWTSPMYPKLYSNDTTENPLGKPITKDEDSWIGSLINVGAVIGAIPAGFVADKFGRKNTLIVMAVPHIVAYIIYAFARNVYLFYIGRIINGISLGAGYAILPMYITEITEDSNRAAFSVTLNIFWTFGNFLPYAIGPYLSVKTFNLILVAVPSTFLICFIPVGVETPHYLIQTGRIAAAEKALMTLRSCDKVIAEKEVQILKETFKKQENVSFHALVKNPGLRKALFISFGLILFQQLSGVNAISYYLEPIFEASGSNLSASISSTICGVCMFISSFTTTFFVKHIGKKWLLAISCLGDALALAVLGAFFYIKEQTTLSTNYILWMPIAGLIGYIFFFNLALGPLPWTISSELFPNNVKAVSSSAVAACSWVSSFFITRFFNLLSGSVGKSGAFWIYGGACFITMIFDILYVPETKGKSLTEIQDMLD